MSGLGILYEFMLTIQNYMHVHSHFNCGSKSINTTNVNYYSLQISERPK